MAFCFQHETMSCGFIDYICKKDFSMGETKQESYSICPFLYVQDVGQKGRGVFTDNPIPENTIIEVSPVLVMEPAARALLDKTHLHDYLFEWGEESAQCCIAWGYISLYNHSYKANCEYFMDFENNIITIKTVREIQAGEELTINYNGDWNASKPVWFDVE